MNLTPHPKYPYAFTESKERCFRLEFPHPSHFLRFSFSLYRGINKCLLFKYGQQDAVFIVHEKPNRRSHREKGLFYIKEHNTLTRSIYQIKEVKIRYTFCCVHGGSVSIDALLFQSHHPTPTSHVTDHTIDTLLCASHAFSSEFLHFLCHFRISTFLSIASFRSFSALPFSILCLPLY